MTILRLAAAVVALAVAMHAPAAEPDAKSGESRPFAVVELFTSEGCSSCPPADEVAAKLARSAESDGTDVYVLSFHVHYWDRLGWRDRFSSPEATGRQYRYSRVLTDDRTYTPQMVVNGTSGFVGSREQTARREVAEALKVRPTHALQADAQVDGDTLRVSFRLAGPKPERGATVLVAIVERSAKTDVKDGENAGRSLTHANVVRSFEEADLGPSLGGELELSLDGMKDRDGLRVIVVAQDERSMAVLAATALDIPAE